MTQRNTTTETSDLSVHAGHRQRLRERFLRGGPDDLAAHELLELLLGYAMPRVDVNPLAHRLIERFGSLSGVTEASVEELMSVSGVGEYTACLIRLLPAVVRRCAIDRVESPRVYDTVGKLVEFLRPRFTGLTTERVYLILLDNGMHMIDCRVISEGSVNSSAVTVRRIAELCLYMHAACAVLAQEDSFYDLRDFEEEGLLDLSAPWYDQNANASISIENRSYFTVSDMSIMQKIVSFSVTYNPELLATKFPNLDLFQTVIDGEWTLDKMLELGREFASDADGNGTQDYNDEWGLVSSHGDAIQFYLASGETLCAKDENDDPIISIGGARSLSVSQKILGLLQQKDWIIHYQDILAQGVPTSEGSNTALRIFGEERALFRVSAFSAIKKLRAYEIDYAIVPMPLADSTQTEYYTPCSAVYAYGIGIPSTLSRDDARFAAYMIDVLSAGGKEYIATAYYDQILKNKDALSDTSKDVDILDLIFENVVYDVGYIYGFSGLSTMHTTLMASGSTDISSHLESIRGQVNQKIEEVIAQFRK